MRIWWRFWLAFQLPLEVFLCKLQTKCDSAGIGVLEKHASHQSMLFFSLCISYLMFSKVYKSIFTLPSSAKNILDDAENMAPTKSQKISSNNSVRCNVASKLHLNDKVTPRSVAYAAIQVCVYAMVSYVVLDLTVTASSISTCKLQVLGLQYMVDLITLGYKTMLSIFLRILWALLQRNMPKTYSTGCQGEGISTSLKC